MNPNMAESLGRDHIRETRRQAVAARLARAARRAARVLAECDYAQRRLFAIMTNPDSYVLDRDTAPGTYAEFLFRTSGGLLHEPAAAERRPGPGSRRAA